MSGLGANRPAGTWDTIATGGTTPALDRTAANDRPATFPPPGVQAPPEAPGDDFRHLTAAAGTPR